MAGGTAKSLRRGSGLHPRPYGCCIYVLGCEMGTETGKIVVFAADGFRGRSARRRHSLSFCRSPACWGPQSQTGAAGEGGTVFGPGSALSASSRL